MSVCCGIKCRDGTVVVVFTAVVHTVGMMMGGGFTRWWCVLSWYGSVYCCDDVYCCGGCGSGVHCVVDVVVLWQLSWGCIMLQLV